MVHRSGQRLDHGRKYVLSELHIIFDHQLVGVDDGEAHVRLANVGHNSCVVSFTLGLQQMRVMPRVCGRLAFRTLMDVKVTDVMKA